VNFIINVKVCSFSFSEFIKLSINFCYRKVYHTGWAKTWYTMYYILYTYFWPTLYVLGAFAKLRKATISFVMSLCLCLVVRLSARM